MRGLAEAGRIVILVTHRLGDLVEHTKRVAVIRDGRVTADLEGEALSEDAIAQQLVLGERREAPGEAAPAKAAAASGGRLFAVAGWTHRAGKFEDLALSVEKGEILALMGVEGSGARDSCAPSPGSSAAAERRRSTGVRETGPRGDPPPHGLCPGHPPVEPLFEFLRRRESSGPPRPAGDRRRRAWRLRKRRMRELAQAAASRFLVKTRTIFQGIRSLSGGNQQKVAIAQALVRQPRLLLLEEPTRGVDIQSKREIYRLLREFAHAGNAVIMFCTEVLEMFEAADRVLIVSDGKLSRPLTVKDYAHVEALVTDVTKLERHGRAAA